MSQAKPHLKQRLILASGNAGKLRELSALLGPLGYELVPQADLGVEECEEPFPSFVENALVKARHAARITGAPALADDSGLCVDMLGGAPGVRSARYAGEPKSDARNNARLLEELAPFPAAKERRARFVCVLAFVRHAEDPQPVIAEGEWVGQILDAPRGADGFGYDPLFWVPGERLAAAELPAVRKNQLSHRAQAMSILVERLTGRA